jgi:hypothetical protein
MSERTVLSTEEPFENASADDVQDRSDDHELSDEELTDDTANEERSSIVTDEDRVEKIPPSGWANQPPEPTEFPEVSRKDGV